MRFGLIDCLRGALASGRTWEAAEAAEAVCCLAHARIPDRCAVPPPSPNAVSSGATASMLNNNDLADCTLVLGAERIPVHWFVLYSQSEYWKAMFRAGMQEARQMEVRVTDVDPAVMRAVITFLYTGEIALSDQNAQPVLMAAVRYQIRSLTQTAEAWISRGIGSDNVFSVLHTSTQLGCTRLTEACLYYLLRHLPEVIAREAPDRATVDAMLSLLEERLVGPPPSPSELAPPPAKRAKAAAASGC